MSKKNKGEDLTDAEQNQQVLTIVNNGFETSDKPVGVLAGLFRRLCMVMSVKAFYWSSLMEMFLGNPANGIDQNAKARATARGNLNKELLREQMSWNVFLKALRFLGAIRVEFTVKIWVTPTKVHEATVTILERVPLEQIKKQEQTQENMEDNQQGISIPMFDENQRRIVLRRKHK